MICSASKIDQLYDGILTAANQQILFARMKIHLVYRSFVKLNRVVERDVAGRHVQFVQFAIGAARDGQTLIAARPADVHYAYVGGAHAQLVAALLSELFLLDVQQFIS